MSRRGRSKRSAYRPSGVAAAPQAQTGRIVDVAASFEAQLGAAALQNAVEARVPYGYVQQIVPGANYRGKPNTAEAHERLRQMKNGVDPALNRKFETASESREFRKREGVDVMSPSEYEAETRGMKSSRRFNSWLDSPDTGHHDPDTGKPVPAFKGRDAFVRGEQVMAAMEQMGMRFG